jgi:hypothetical protein
VGSLTTKTRTIAEKALADGVTPLEVMLNNMRFHHAESTSLLERLIERAQEAQPIEAAELKDLLAFLHKTRSMAQECARDAAPYIHPRLSTVDANLTGDMALKIEVVRFADDPTSK